MSQKQFLIINMLRDEYINNNISEQCNLKTRISINILTIVRVGNFGNIEGFEIRDKF